MPFEIASVLAKEHSLCIFDEPETGIGAALSLNMRIVPNPGDGIVQAIADCTRKSVGFTKNCVDIG